MQQITLLEYIEPIKGNNYTGNEAVQVLKHIFDYLRPNTKKEITEAKENFTQFITILQQDDALMQGISKLVANVIVYSNITPLLTSNGLVTSVTFAQQAKRIINEKIIPPYQEPTDIQTVLNTILYKKWDWLWIAALPKELLQPLISHVHNALLSTTNDVYTEVCNAAKVISYRIASMGLEDEVLIRANQKEALLTPFTEQNELLIAFFKCEQENKEKAINTLRASILQCSQNLLQLERNSIVTGTSINQTFLLRRLTQHINRLKFIIGLLQQHKPLQVNAITYFIKEAIYYLKTKNRLRSFASANLNLIAYRIVDHTKDTGEKYITSTRTEYWKILTAAAGGGFIVSILVLLKFEIGTMHVLLFWEAFLYSLNYAIGFIAIQLLGCTLATKQPAMTASTLVNALKGAAKKDFIQMAITVSRVCRTQFISILGNVLMVIPSTVLWLCLYQLVTGNAFCSGEAASKLLYSNHPYYSLSLLYAGIAGVFLFVSGIISGYVENRIVYNKVPQRIVHQPILKRIIPKRWMSRFSNFVALRGGAILGNLSLGIFLGMASFIGKIFGIPFDIRHITFAAGNVAMGIYHGGTSSWLLVGGCVLCIIMIGLLNLIVSFTLAFYVAMKARNLHLADFPELGKMVLKHLYTTPKEFFFPTKGGRSAFADRQDNALYNKDLGIE